MLLLTKEFLKCKYIGTAETNPYVMTVFSIPSTSYNRNHMYLVASVSRVVDVLMLLPPMFIHNMMLRCVTWWLEGPGQQQFNQPTKEEEAGPQWALYCTWGSAGSKIV